MVAFGKPSGEITADAHYEDSMTGLGHAVVFGPDDEIGTRADADEAILGRSKRKKPIAAVTVVSALKGAEYFGENELFTHLGREDASHIFHDEGRRLQPLERLHILLV